MTFLFNTVIFLIWLECAFCLF